MINFFLNSRILLVFVIPLFLGCLSVFSFQPYNFVIINFAIFPCLFFILCNINKRSKNKYRKKPHLINLFYSGYSFGVGFFLTGTYWISNSLQFDETFCRHFSFHRLCNFAEDLHNCLTNSSGLPLQTRGDSRRKHFGYKDLGGLASRGRHPPEGDRNQCRRLVAGTGVPDPSAYDCPSQRQGEGL